MPDDVLRDRVDRAIAAFDPIRRLGLGRLSVDVADGVVTLTGHVGSDTHKSAAAEMAANVAGVQAVDNQLVSDGELQRALIRTFQQLPETHAVHGPVDVHLGTVTLHGPAPSKAFAGAAPAAALSVPGVRAVIDLLDFDHVAAGEQRAVEALFGRPIIFNGRKVGRLEQLFVRARPWELKHAVIKRGRLAPEWLLVPGQALSRSDLRYVYLDLQPAQLDRLPAYLDASLTAPLTDRKPDLSGLWRLRAGQRVITAHDGVVGRLAGLRMDPRSGKISHLAVRPGRFMRVVGWLPAGECVRWDSDVLTLLAKEQVERLIETGGPRSDRAIIAEVHNRLLTLNWHATPAGIVGLRIDHGHVTLHGCLRDAGDRAGVEQLVTYIRGVAGVDNQNRINFCRGRNQAGHLAASQISSPGADSSRLTQSQDGGVARQGRALSFRVTGHADAAHHSAETVCKRA